MKANWLGKIRPSVTRLVFLSLLFTFGGCSVKRTVRVNVSPKLLAAKSANMDELLAILARYEADLQSLSASDLRLSYASGQVESGEIQQYRSARGYLLLQRPESLRLNIQNPITKTTIAEMSSQGDDFVIWYPRENKYFMGKNSIREFEVEGGEKGPVITARPEHIYDALALSDFDIRDGSSFIAMEESQDETAKYYELTLFHRAGSWRLRPVRRVWFERSEMVVTRQETFADDGALSSIVLYSNYTVVDRFLLPQEITIDRPIDGYSLSLEFRSWRVNPELTAEAFHLPKPPAAQLILLEEKIKE